MTKTLELDQRATDSGSLTNRANDNKRFGQSDFDAWVRVLIDGLRFTSVLDICCGTGNQLVLYAQRPDVRCVVGVDASAESVATARERVQRTGTRATAQIEALRMEAMFGAPWLKDARFDLISCVYGLYYSDDVAFTLRQMVEHLGPRGSVLVVGPYGANNASLFGLLQRHFTLPELVTRSATTFMEQEVVPELSRSLGVRTQTFVNPVTYRDPEALLKYWRSSTFYSESHAAAVERDVRGAFARDRAFVVEKHVMACIATAP